MRIAIEGQRLFRAKKHGMDMVALELIKSLQTLDTVNEYFIFVNPDVDDKCLTETKKFKIIKLEGGSYPKWEQIALSKAVNQYNCDILHCTSNTAPIRCNVPLVITLHDIIYMESISLFKKGFTTYQKFGNMYRRLVVPRVIKKAKKVITVSNYERKRISDFFGLSDNKLVAVYNGVSEHFVPITDNTELERIKTKYKLPDNFFFFLGNTDPKKNTKGTLKAFSDYVKLHGDKYKLVMLDYDESELQKLLTEINDTNLRKLILLTGYLDNKDLPAIYSQCDIFLYPSLRESFGIPMLEAMRCGAPVITSNTSSMPEVSGDAALLIDPYKPEEITQAIINLLNDNDLRKELSEKGLKRAQEFSWNAMAKDVLKIYEELK